MVIIFIAQDTPKGNFMSSKTIKSSEEWQACLTPEEYRVLRDKGTEMAFTGKYYNHKEKGIYVCAACGYELFSSKSKFDSGSGWPSFWEAISKNRIIKNLDNNLGMVRTEILCGQCESHLGHLFEDGPQPTGDRYCVNSLSLNFKNNEDNLRD